MFLCAYGDFEGCERGIVLSMVWGRWRNLKQFIAETQLMIDTAEIEEGLLIKEEEH